MKLDFVDTSQYADFNVLSDVTQGWRDLGEGRKYKFMRERFDYLYRSIDDAYVTIDSVFEGLIGDGELHCSMKLCGKDLYVVFHSREEVQDVYNHLSQIC